MFIGGTRLAQHFELSCLKHGAQIIVVLNLLKMNKRLYHLETYLSLWQRLNGFLAIHPVLSSSRHKLQILLQLKTTQRAR
jgi:hypothetical protein